MQIRSLYARVVALFALFLIAAQLLTFIFVNTILSRDAERAIRHDLEIGERVFNRLREQRTVQLLQSATLLSLDFAFRDAIASRSHETIASALENHGARINADVMIAIALDNRVLADTLEPQSVGKLFPFPELTAAVEREGRASSEVVIQGRAYQLVLVPVRAPLPIAWVGMGFLMDDKLAVELESLTLLKVSFLDAKDANWTVLATTMPPEPRAALPAALRSISPLATGSTSVRLSGEDYQTLIVPLGRTGDVHIVAVLQRSVRESLQPLVDLRMALLALGVGSLLASILGCLFLARGVTRPLNTLAGVARSIEKGDYSQPIDIQRRDEVGDLAAAFNHMRLGIAVREREITELAQRDSLTGLPNRMLFTDRLQQAISVAMRQGHPVCVLLLDLDNFKYVNDTLGHHNGDRMLQDIAERLKFAVLRDTDTVARLGGDEFAVLLPGDDSAAGSVVARRVLDVLERPVFLERQAVDVRGSIGIASCPEHGEDVSTIMRRADTAMYVAKRGNAGFAAYDPSFDHGVHESLSLMGELRRAVEENELVLHYQPKIRLSSGAVTDVEALVRWQHPVRGLVAPDKFIPFAEHTGFIRKVTRWVIEHALRQCHDWRGNGIDIGVSINISAHDLVDQELPAIFAEMLAVNRILPQWLCLEITESAIMTDTARAHATLERLHAMDVRLSIDDFGTGYSSLSYLKKLPVSEIKIDKSFVRDMASDKDDATIVRSTIDLAHNMGLTVVAEGVEDEESCNVLRLLGCDHAQGYFISEPIPASAFEGWLAARSIQSTA